MKGILSILCLSWALTGCQKPDLDDPEVFEEIASQASDLGTLVSKRVKGLMVLCIPGTEKPFSGWVKENYENGRLKRLGYLNEGAKDGLWNSWHENGEKQLELRYKKDGKIEELAVGEGFVEVSDNKVSVLIDLAIGEDAIDEAKVEEAMKRAQEALAGENVDHDEMAALQAAIAKSEAMLKLKRKRL